MLFNSYVFMLAFLPLTHDFIQSFRTDLVR